MVHRRRETKGLNTDQVRELNTAWHHAARIGRPLNVMVSLRPLDIDAMTPAERCQLFAAFRNKLGVYARGRRFVPTYAWSREVHPDGNGEHMHVLMHVPSRHRPRLLLDDRSLLIEWKPAYKRGFALQASLAVVGFLLGIAAWWQAGHPGWLIGALLMIANWPFTILAIMPTNNKLMATELAAAGPESRAMVERWGLLHAVRTVLGFAASIAFLLASLL